MYLKHLLHFQDNPFRTRRQWGPPDKDGPPDTDADDFHAIVSEMHNIFGHTMNLGHPNATAAAQCIQELEAVKGYFEPNARAYIGVRDKVRPM